VVGFVFMVSRFESQPCPIFFLNVSYASPRVSLMSYMVSIRISVVIKHKFQYIACSLALKFSGFKLWKKFIYNAIGS